MAENTLSQRSKTPYQKNSYTTEENLAIARLVLLLRRGGPELRAFLVDGLHRWCKLLLWLALLPSAVTAQHPEKTMDINSDCPSIAIRPTAVTVKEAERTDANGRKSTVPVKFITLEFDNTRDSALVGVVCTFDKKKLFKQWPDRGTTSGQSSPLLNVGPGKIHKETLSLEDGTEEVTIAGACWKDGYCEGDSYKGSDGAEVKFSEQIRAFNAGAQAGARQMLSILEDPKATDAQVESRVKSLKEPNAPGGLSEAGKGDFHSGYSNQRDNAVTTIEEHKAQHRGWREDVKKYQEEVLR
jgi:hypothetical protein